MSISFMVFAMSMFVVYADANSDVLAKRTEIDKIKADIKFKKELIATLVDEREFWEDRVTKTEDTLDEREAIALNAKNDYEKALQTTVQTVEDIEAIEAIKIIYENKLKDIPTAETNLANTIKDLKDYEDRLAENRNDYNILIRDLPDEEDLLDKLEKIANRTIPVGKDGKFRNIIISIILSDACLLSDVCPNYMELADIYDNSNRYISGEFILVESYSTKPIYGMIDICGVGNCSTNSTLQIIGEETIMIWKRDVPKYDEHTIEWYSYSEIPVMTFVDPDDQTRSKSKQIIIEPHLQEGYLLPSDINFDGNYTLSFPKDRHIYGCSDAIIGWNPHADELLADTWNYFYNNCAEETDRFNETVDLHFEPSYFTDCSTWCEHLRWIAESKELAKNYLLGDKVLK